MSYELWLGDCLQEMDRIEAGSVDMILADLPYEKIASEWDSIIPFEPLWKQYKQVIKRNGAVVLFAGQPFTSLLIMSNPSWFRQELIWDKMQGCNFALAKKRILPAHENILVFYQALPTYYPQFSTKPKDRIRPPKKQPQLSNKNVVPMASGYWANSKDYNPEISYPISILRFSASAAECNSQYRSHPTQKPVALLSYLIKTYTNPGELVLDNTCGSGSTGEACLLTGRRFIGIEKDEGYYQIASNRLEQVRAKLSNEDLPMFKGLSL